MTGHQLVASLLAMDDETLSLPARVPHMGDGADYWTFEDADTVQREDWDDGESCITIEAKEFAA